MQQQFTTSARTRPGRIPPTVGGRRQTGFTLVEILIALLVLSIGLLGLAMLQLQGLRFGTDSYLRTQATLLATDLMDRIIANKTAADAGAYCLNTAAPADPCVTNALPTGANYTTCGDTTAGCATPEETAKYDLTTWYNALDDQITLSTTTPTSISRTTQATSGGQTVFRYTITINWMERDAAMSQTWVVDL